MPNTQKYKSVAVPVSTWEKLWDEAKINYRSPSQQITFWVDQASKKRLEDSNNGTTTEDISK